MIAVIESGATKSDWRVIREDGCQCSRHLGQGMNVSTMKMETIKSIMKEAADLMTEPTAGISELHLYIAGVVTECIRHELAQTLALLFPNASIEIQDDLTAAARAICGHRPGIAAILGTGSNSCQYDGEKIIKRVYSGGYILGDEGSAASLGKKFLADFIKGLVPQHIAEVFAAGHDSSYGSIVEKVYRASGSPSAYLGSLAPFIASYYSDPYVKELVDDNFRSFFQRTIRQYDHDSLPVGIAGGFGNAMKDIILDIAKEEGIQISAFVEKPIENLIKYHNHE